MNRIYLPVAISPWKDLRSFISRNYDIFPTDSKASFRIGLHNTRHDIKDVFDIHFRRFSGCGDVFVFGEAGKFRVIGTSIELDPYQEKGKISIPEFGGSVRLDGNKFYLEQNSKTSPLFPPVAELYMKFYWRVLDHIICGEDKPIDLALNEIRLRKYSYKFQ